jgi:hypothetical protein
VTAASSAGVDANVAILLSSFAVNETAPASFDGAIPIWGYQYFSFILGTTATNRGESTRVRRL